MNVAVLSASVNEKLGAGSFEGSGGSAVIPGEGGGVPSTATTGCPPWIANEVESCKSVVVHVYVASAEGALAPKAIERLPPGQSSLPASGATASMDAPLSEALQVAAVQVPAAVVVAESDVGSTTNPAGTPTCALFA